MDSAEDAVNSTPLVVTLARVDAPPWMPKLVGLTRRVPFSVKL